MDASMLAAARGERIPNFPSTQGTTPEPLFDDETDDAVPLRRRLHRAILTAKHALRAQQRPEGDWHTTAMVPVPFLVETLLALAAIGEESSECAARCVAMLKASLETAIPPVCLAPTPDRATRLYLAIKIYRLDFPRLAETLTELRMHVAATGGLAALDTTTRLWLAVFGQQPYSARLAAQKLWPSQWRVLRCRFVRPLEVTRGVRELFETAHGLHNAIASITIASLAKTWLETPRAAWFWKPLTQCWAMWNAAWWNASSPSASRRDRDEMLWEVVALAADSRTADSGTTASGTADWRGIQRLARIESLFTTSDTQTLTLSTEDERLAGTATAALVLSSTSPHATQTEIERAIAWGREQYSAPTDVESLTAILTLEGCRFRATHRRSSPTAEVESLPPDLRLVATTHVASLADAKRRVASLTETADDLQHHTKHLIKLQSPRGLWGTLRTTGEVLQALGRLGMWRGSDRAIDHAIAALASLQHRSGRWSEPRLDSTLSESLLTTAAVTTGLAAVGLKSHEETLAFAANWLLAQEWPLAASAEASEAVIQVASAVQALVVSGHFEEPAVKRGVEWLLAQQNSHCYWGRCEGHEIAGTSSTCVIDQAEHTATCRAVMTLVDCAHHARDRLRRTPPVATSCATIPIRAIRLYLQEHDH